MSDVLPPDPPQNAGERRRNTDSSLAVSIQRASWVAPLPPPEILAKFDDAVKDGGERIFHEFEEEAAHRRLLATIELKAAISERRLAQWLAFAFAMVCLGVATVAILTDKQIVGSVIGAGCIVGVVTAFLRSPRTVDAPQSDSPESAPHDDRAPTEGKHRPSTSRQKRAPMKRR